MENRRLEGGRQVRVDRPRRGRRIFDVLAGDLVPVVSLERQPTGGRSVEGHAERVDVGSTIQTFRPGLLWREILRCADDHVRSGLTAVTAERARDTKVGDDRV